ncbi:TPA: lysis system o-spanin lipoprotein Rz1, partial [Salmonella enterica subsp. enterica serovar Potsdam]
MIPPPPAQLMQPPPDLLRTLNGIISVSEPNP